MIDNAESKPTAVLDAILKSCSISRERGASGNYTQHSRIQVGLVNPPSSEVDIAFSVTLEPSEQNTESSAQDPIIDIQAEYRVFIREPLPALPDDLAAMLVNFVWPYLRSVFDVLTGLARIPCLPLPVVVPQFDINPSTE